MPCDICTTQTAALLATTFSDSLLLVRYTQELATLELKPMYEDVFQTESCTVEEYLQQVHEMTVITAIQVRACCVSDLLSCKHLPGGGATYGMGP